MNFKTPPDCFDSPHNCYKDSVMQKFKCKDCHKEFNSIEKVTEHKDNETLRFDAWTELIQKKMENDKRLKEFYQSPAVIKHLTVETNLPLLPLPMPNPVIEEAFQENELMDVTLAHEDTHQIRTNRVCLGSTTPTSSRQNIRQICKNKVRR